jgi:carbamoylphosphate synthase large subunit
LDRFENSTNIIDSAMKSIGEVMAIGRSFEECFQKALRSTHGSILGFSDSLPMNKSYESDFDIRKNLEAPNTNRIYVIAKVLYIKFVLFFLQNK